MEEKRYAQLTRESISILADSGGFLDLSESVASLLAEDVNYRLRETIQKASRLMRHSKRRKLNSEDVNRALKWSNVEPIYGYFKTDPLKPVHIKECDVFAVEDTEINLVTEAISNPSIPQVQEPYIKAQWLAIEGVPLGVTSKKNVPVTPVVPANLMTYYDQITKTILGSDEELLKIAFDDLQNNFKISPVLPHLVNFVSVGVKKLSHDLTQLTKLLQTINCLIRNKSLYLGTQPYLMLLTQSLLYCILEPLAASINPINDHWILRDLAAQLLAQILREWSNPVNKLYSQTITTLKDSFCDLSKPYSTHYGAAVAVAALGVEEMERILYPSLPVYWNRLQLTLEDSNYLNSQLKADAQKVHGILMLMGELILRVPQNCVESKGDEVSDTVGIVKLEIKKECDEKVLPDPESVFGIYQRLYDYFGDALSARLPLIDTRGIYKPKKEEDIRLFATEELSMSGEELLEMFNVQEKEEDTRSNNSMDDDNSEEENSGMSDDQEAGGPVELQIRSTISDPALGIKLTIAKLRRTIQEEPKPVKKKKFSIPKESVEPEEIFEYLQWKSLDGPLRFNFVGGTSKSYRFLRRRKVSFSSLVEGDGVNNSSTWKLSLKMKLTGKRKVINKRNAWKWKISTGTLNSVL